MATEREPRVAVVGATGAVGSQLVELLETRAFPKGKLTLYTSADGASRTVAVEEREEELEVEEFLGPDELRGFDLAFLAVPERLAREIVQARPGPVLIDLSAALRRPNPEFPMVAPGLTPRARLQEMRGGMVFALPHPAAHALATILSALGVESGFVGVAVMVGASAGGRDLITATVEQSAGLLSGSLDIEPEEVQRGFNVFVSESDRETAEVFVAQTRFMMGREPKIALQVINAPILHGSIVAIQLPRQPESAGWRERLRAAPGILLVEDRKPLGVIDALGQEAIVVRMDESECGVALFCALDNARLAALNALWIAENLLLTAN